MLQAFVDLALHGDVLSHGGWKGYARDQWTAMLAASPEANPESSAKRENPFVAGPIWAQAVDDCFTAEIQTIGGHQVVAMVHGGTYDEAEQRQRAILAALHPVDSPAAKEREA